MSNLRFSLCMIALLMLGLVACQGPGVTPDAPSSAPVVAQPGAPTAPPARPVAAQPTTSPAVQAQINRGQMLFAQSCASCHGRMGEGTSRAPAVIGEGTLPLNPPAGARLRRVRFQSAMDLGMFIKDNMPYGGQHLPPSDVACVLAWLLQKHGRTPTQPISPVTARAITR